MNSSTELDYLTDDSSDVSATHEFLAFMSDGLNFAIDTKYVTDIITNYDITLLPGVPPHIRGIINLRGQIIPVIDARLRMRQPQAEAAEVICIIILDVNDVILGVLVDSVSRVLNLDMDGILPPPVNNRQEIVTGIVHVEGESYLIIDCERLAQ